MRSLHWLAVQFALGACLYFGYVHDVVGARNILYAWIGMALLFVYLEDKTDAGAIKAAGRARPVPTWLGRPWRLAVMAFLVWHGAWGTLIAYAIPIGFHEGMRLKGERLLSERAQ